MYTIVADPSVDHCGLAVFKAKKLIFTELIKPTRKSDHYLVKAREIAWRVEDVCDHYSSKGSIQLVTEITQTFGNAGYLARESGAVMKLAFLAGMIYNITPDTVSYEPQQWKAQLPKCVVRARLSKIAPELKLYGKKEIVCSDCKRKHREHDMDHNIVDAIAIGYKHILGRI